MMSTAGVSEEGVAPVWLASLEPSVNSSEEVVVPLSLVAAFYYFAHFLFILPIVSKIEKPLPLPSSITAAVLGEEETATAALPATEVQPA